MKKSITILYPVTAALCLSMLLGAGCAKLADKDGIKIAKVNGKYITRGDLKELLTEMDDTKRPKIRSRNDLRNVLMKEIDRRIMIPLGEKLAAEGKVTISDDEAREKFFKDSGSDEEQYRTLYKMEIPADGKVTPLMKEFGFTLTLLKGMKEIIKDGTETTKKELQGEAAVLLLANQAAEKGDIKLTQEQINTEYEFRQWELVKKEHVHFIAMRIFANTPDAAAIAAQLRSRIDQGETFEAVANELHAKDARFLMESDIENNPAVDRFKSFWASASGAKAGDIIGPIYLPSYQAVKQDPQGGQQAISMPDFYLVLKVLDSAPERQVPLEEARPLLEPNLMRSEMLKILRVEHQVEVYNEQIPDPTQGDGALSEMMLKK